MLSDKLENVAAALEADPSPGRVAGAAALLRSLAGEQRAVEAETVPVAYRGRPALRLAGGTDTAAGGAAAGFGA